MSTLRLQRPNKENLVSDNLPSDRVVQLRIAGKSYAEVSAATGISHFMCRRICKRAYLKGQVTAEQIRHKPIARKPRFSDAEYNSRWISRLKSRCAISESGCWIWQGILTSNGYAQDQYRGKTISVHRQMYKVTRGVEIPKKPQRSVCHTCDVRPCINPDHLWLGSQKENLADSVRKGRHQETKKTECERGHPFTPENTYYAKGREGRGARHCKACQRGRQRVLKGWPVEVAYSMPAQPLGYLINPNRRAA